MPARAKSCRASRVQSLPPTAIEPACGRWKPERTLTSVVLPAPFGPIRPSTSPFASGERHVVDRHQPAEADGDTLGRERIQGCPSSAALAVADSAMRPRYTVSHRLAGNFSTVKAAVPRRRTCRPVTPMIAIGRVVWMCRSAV